MNKVRQSLFVLACLSALVAGFIWIRTWRTPHARKTTRASGVMHYDKVNQLWVDRRYEKLDSYMSKLGRDFPDHVQVQLLMAVYCYKNGAQVEETLKQLKRIHQRLDNDMLSSSPLFVDLLESRIARYSDLEKTYQEYGISQAQRLAERSPLRRTKFTHSKKWGDEELFFNAPDVFITNNLVIPVQPVETAAPSPILMAKTEKELKQIIYGDNTPILERKAAVNALVARRRAVGLQEVSKGLYEAEMLYTYNDTADELVRAGHDAVPVILGVMNEPAHSLRDKKYMIWPLVRIGDTRPEVLQALQVTATNTAAFADDRAYAERALRHLQKGKP